MAENQRKTFATYIFNGGLGGIKFVYPTKHSFNSDCNIYEAKSLVPRRSAHNKSVDVEVEWLDGGSELFPLEALIYHQEATPGEVKRVRRSGLAKALAKKAQSSIGEGLRKSFAIDPCQI